jgi:hypothetical protein
MTNLLGQRVVVVHLSSACDNVNNLKQPDVLNAKHTTIVASFRERNF